MEESCNVSLVTFFGYVLMTTTS